MRLAQAGSFAATGNGALPQIDNAGTLQFSVDSGKSKPVENALTGTGSVEKLDAGTLVLESKLNTYSGKTILSGGILQIGDNTALGTGSVGSIVFNGGALRYGDRVTADLSKRISPIQAGLSALVDVGTNEVVYASSLSGAGGLSKSGTGTLQFAANQNFEGDLSVAAGVVQIGSGTLGSIKAAAISVDSGASVRFKRSDSLVYAGTIKGAGTVEQAGDGTLTLSGDGQAFSGTYVLSSGVLLLDGANALSQGSITFKNGTLKYGQSGPSGAAADLSGRFNPVDAGFTATIDTSSSNVTYSSSLTGSGTLRKLGTGTLAFSDGAVNPLRTSVGAGALHYNGSQAINAAGTIDTSTGTTVQFTNADNAQFTGSLQGAGSFVKAGMGALEMLNAQAISGEVRIAAGSLVLGVKSSLKGLVTLEKQATLDIASTEAALQNADLTIRGNLIVAGGITLVKSVNLDGGTLTLRSATDETAFILVTGSIKGEVPAGNVQVGTLTTGANGVSVIGGSLSGSLRNLPANSELNFQGTGDNKQARLFAGTFSSISAQMGTNLKLEEKVTVNGGVLIGGSSILTLGGSSVLSASSLNIASGSTVYLEEKAALKAVEIVVGTSNAERLIVSGTLELANQVLKGSGTIEGTVRVAQGAVLSPGNSPGTLTVGTLAIGEGGTLVLEHGQAAVDKLVTGGSLTLSNGAQILLVDYDRSLLAGTSGYAFSGSVATSSPVEVTMAVRLGNETGTVGDDGVSYPIATSALYSGSLTSAGSLVVKRLSAAQVVGAAGNLEKVALSVESRLKALSKTPFEVTDFDRIGTGATAAEAKLNLAQQLSAINPSAYAELAALSTQRTLNLHQGLVGHFSSVRANLNDAPDGAFSAWTTGYGAGHKQDGNRSLGTAGFTASTWGDMFGVEQRIGGFLLGVTGAAGRTSATFSSNPGSATTDSWHGGLYGALDMDGLILESGAMLGATDTRVRRTILATGLTTREGRATLSGSEWTANLGLAKPIAASEALTITPSIRVIVQGQSQNAAAESDLSGLEVSLAKQRTTTLQHQAGMEIRRKLRLAGRPAAASLQLDWIHNYNAKGRDLNMALSGDPSASYAYKGSDAGADSIHIGAAFEAALTERVTLRLGGEYQSQTGLSTVRGSVSLGYQF
jgi:autotransporter-associated beta strand protein